MTNYQILFRVDSDNHDEFCTLRSLANPGNLTTQRSNCSKSTVIGRYSVLPYYQELCNDLAKSGCKLINSYRQHQYIANFEYFQDISSYTFQTWDHPHLLPEGQFVVKGRTNSRKQRWNTQMFAPTRTDAIALGHELLADPLIGPQGVIYRKFEKLKILEVGLHDLPFSNEHRVFYLKSNDGLKRIAHGFYWSQSYAKGVITSEGLNLADKVATIISSKCNFFAIDVAEKEDGSWIVVEVNDGQMSGLSTIDHEMFYNNLLGAIGVA